MLQGLAQTFLVRLPMSYIMSIQPDASLTKIGLAAPSATIFGIIINVCYFFIYSKRINAINSKEM
jgi:Na+-driven multidrug efflux pump